MDIIKYPSPINLNDFENEPSNLKILYGLPGSITYCKKCVISNQRPNSAIEYNHMVNTKKTTIHFDDNGICDACNFTENKNKLFRRQI